MNANPLLKKLTKLRDVLKDEQANRNEALAILDANVASLKQEYDSLLIDYIKESRLLKGVTWKLCYDGSYDAVSLQELDWKVDLKSELEALAEREYEGSSISLLSERVEHGNDSYVSSLITLWLYDEATHPPYIQFRSIEHLATFITDYELDVDLTGLQKVIDTKQAEVAILNSIKQRVPN